MATVTKPIALDESFNTTELTPRNIADVLAQELSRITGRNASQVEYDNTESGLTADNVQDALDEIVEDIPTVPSVDIQTAVDEFETYNGGILDSLKVALSPNQDLHGYSEPWVGGAGKNKCPLTVDGIKSANTTVTWNGNSCIFEGVTITILTDTNNNVIGLKFLGTASRYFYFNVNSNFTINGTYIISPLPQGAAYSSAFYGRLYYTDGTDTGFLSSEVTVTKQSAVGRMQIVVSTNSTVDFTYQPMLRLSTESDPTFEPYSNICPISGHTQVDVDVSDGETTQEQVTVNLGGTYYSGILDVVTGVFTPDTVERDLSTLVWSYQSTQTRFIANVADIKRDNTWNNIFLISSCYKVGVPDSSSNYVIGVNDNNIYIKNTDYTDPTALKASLTGQKVVYELATPTPIQLSPTMVKALVGENHLSAPLEGQEITESKYKQMFTFDDVIAYIQSLS